MYVVQMPLQYCIQFWKLIYEKKMSKWAELAEKQYHQEVGKADLQDSLRDKYVVHYGSVNCLRRDQKNEDITT